MLVIDGNNVLGVLGRDRSPENILWVIQRLREFQKKETIHLFFDGLAPFGPDVYDQDTGFHIHWIPKDKGENDADDAIVRFVRSQKNAGALTMISDDKALKLLLGGVCKHLSSTLFAQRLTKIHEPIFNTDDKDAYIDEIDTPELYDELLDAFS